MAYEDINRSELMLPTSDGAKKTYVETSADQVVTKSGRSVEEALGDMYVNVKDFGAKGDGVTDDTDAIQTAITFALSKNYFVVYFPSGSYKISRTLTVSTKLKLQGAGMLNTTIITASNTIDAITLGNGIRGFELEDLTVRCNSGLGTNNAAIRFNYENGGYECRLVNVNIFTFYYGIHAGDRLWNNTFENVRVNRCAYNLYIYATNGNSVLNLFNRVYLNEATKENFFLYGLKNPMFLSCNFGGSSEFERMGTINATRNAKFDNCNFETAALAQNDGLIMLRGYSEVFVDNCTFMSINLKTSVTRAYLFYTRDTSNLTLNGCFLGNSDVNLWDFYVINTSKVIVLNGNSMSLKRTVVPTATFLSLTSALQNYVSRASQKNIYNQSHEYVNIVEGYSFGGTSIREKKEFLSLKIEGFVGQAAYVTNERVDLSEVKKIFIEWENTGTNECYLCVADSKSDGYTFKVRDVSKSNSFSRIVTALDVSDINTMYYIRVHSRSLDATVSELKVYKIWTE